MSKPVCWPATICPKCGEVVRLCVDKDANRTWTEHSCPAGDDAARHINACR